MLKTHGRAGGELKSQNSKIVFPAVAKKRKESEKGELSTRFELASTARKSDALSTRLQMLLILFVGQTVAYLTAFLSG